MKFFADYINIVLLGTFCVSAWILFAPAFRRSAGGLSVAEATQLINRKNAVIIDLRTDDFFAKGHIPLAKNIHLDHLAEKIVTVSKKKQTPILLVCVTGSKAQKAKSVLEQLGYTEVHVLDGGMGAWKQAEMPIL